MGVVANVTPAELLEQIYDTVKIQIFDDGPRGKRASHCTTAVSPTSSGVNENTCLNGCQGGAVAWGQ